jgi:hypothetical protein
MDDFAETLHAKGYGVWAAQAYLRAAAHLGIWMKRKGFSVMKLDEQVIGEFARHLPLCRCLGKNRGIYDDAVIGARHFLDHLRDTGVAPAGAPLEKPPLPTLIDGFERWMRQHRGVIRVDLNDVPIDTDQATWRHRRNTWQLQRARLKAQRGDADESRWTKLGEAGHHNYPDVSALPRRI